MAELLVDEAEKMKAFIPFSIMLKVWEAEDNGKLSVNVPEKSLNQWRKKWNDYNYKFNVLLPKCVELNNKGSEYEKRGCIKDAISLYEQNILSESYPAQYAYDRLLVLYRKQKDYQNELRVCQRAMIVFKSIQKYQDRMCKIKSQIEKINIK